MPRIEHELWHANHGTIPVIAIARGETAEKIRAFNEARHFTFPLVADPDKRIYQLFAAEFIPRTYVLDRHGIVVHQSLGYTPRIFAATLKAVEAASR